ncbi:hypothetical protein NPIL_240881 [Nephila pilipes]|uniref:Uncharacterized protein n=1 Tax=Nephila pilipes TaxID=299642 RepID=A0A8X6MWI5_NEPPI|nr:hypothetical protein NPIL_240881 [Nephila pilipes]
MCDQTNEKRHETPRMKWEIFLMRRISNHSILFCADRTLQGIKSFAISKEGMGRHNESGFWKPHSFAIHKQTVESIRHVTQFQALATWLMEGLEDYQQSPLSFYFGSL